MGAIKNAKLLSGLLEGLLEPGVDPFLVSGLGAVWGSP